MIPDGPCYFIFWPNSGFCLRGEEQAPCQTLKFAEFSHIQKNIGYFSRCDIDENITQGRGLPAGLMIS